jgi:hypothetical protein
MLEIPYKIMAIVLVGTAIILAIAFGVALPFNFFM